MKKYNRFELIYRQMSANLRNKFINTYNLHPYSDKDIENYKFDECMKKFIKDNPHNLELCRSCEIFPDLQNIPHPDRIPESWGLNPIGREIMKDGYIEKIEEENAELHEKNDDLKTKNDGLTDVFNDMEIKLDKQKELISALTDENAGLRIIITELKKENSAITDEKAGLAAQLTELKTKQLDIMTAVHELKSELFDITKERDDLKDEFSKLQINFVNLETEKDKLKNQLSIIQSKMVCPTEEKTELRRELSEPTKQFIPAEANQEQTIETGPEMEFTDQELSSQQIVSCSNGLPDSSDTAPALSIYHKFFVPPLVKNRYRLLTDEEKDWIRENTDLTEMDYMIFDLCCEHDSLKDVSEITELSYSKIKRTSSAIMEKIRIAVAHRMVKGTSDDNNER